MPYLGLRGTPLLVAIAIVSGIGFTLYGVDDSALGSVIASTPFEARFKLDATGQGGVTGSYELGCFVGAGCVALFGEMLSRRHLLWAAVLPLVAGTAIQVACYHVPQLVVGRVIAGVGMGAISSTVPIWQSECAPAHLRGRLMCTALSCLILGQCIAYWAAYALLQKYDTDMTWRVMFSLQGFAALLLALGLVFMPESPRFLVAHEKYDEARVVLSALLDRPQDDPAVLGQIEEIAHAVKLERESAASWKDLFRKTQDGAGEKHRMLLAVGIQVAAEGSYVTTIFEDSVGLSENLATLLSGFLQVWFLVASFATMWLIEHAGRRNMFLVCALMMAVVFFLMGGLEKVGSRNAGIGATIMVFLYQSFFTWGWMAGVWVYTCEINPLSWRTKGTGLAVALQWLFDFVLLMVTPIGIANIGYGMFLIFAIFNLAFVPIIYLFYPETAGLPLELIDEMFMPGKDPLKESRRLRAELKARGGHYGLDEAMAEAGVAEVQTGKGEVEQREVAEKA
ncbi:hypothetical protein Q5752_001556 [Cryptotrichosporon argae]